MLMMIGPIQFDIAPFNAHAIDHATQTDFAEKAVVGAMMPLEWVGEGAETWTIDGRLYPQSIGGLNELQALQQIRASGRPQFMLRGDGTVFGWVVVTAVRDRSSYLDATGVGKQIDVSISVRRSPAPSASSFFSLMAGLLS